MIRQPRKILSLSVQTLCLAAVMMPTLAGAGSYMFAGEANGLDVITHPSGYTGTGGVLDVTVCIDSAAADAAAMAVPVQNIIREINAMTATSPNLIYGNNNDIPGGAVDFQSLTLHELGHCTGLGHPNLGVQSDPEVSGVNTDFTATGTGVDDEYSFDAGVDAVIGNEDDQRGDDPNLHWFEVGVNNPFAEPAGGPDSINYSRDLADLPGGDDFPINAERIVGGLIGFADTEAVMQQGQGTDEDQRALQADDVTTYRMGMTGADEISGTGDDYTINMIYGGIKGDTSACDIVIESQLTGFGVCSIGGSFINGNHLRITSATFRYNSNVVWYFNQVGDCDAGSDDLTFSNVTHNDGQVHDACASVTYGPDYVLEASGSITVTAPRITLGPGTTIRGTFSATALVP